ncbi:MAG: MarR family transcriptional regulator [Acidimicrobiales bacterium]
MAKATGGQQPRPTELHDHVERLLQEWPAVRPDLDVTPIGVVYRLTRIAAAWSLDIERVFNEAGITSTDFAVLANLNRVGPPYRLSQRELMTALRLTSGTVSLRIDKLATRGLVERHVDPADSRAAVIALTDAGKATFDAVAPRHLANEARLPAALPHDDLQTLERILKTLLIDLEQPDAGRPDLRLGFRTASAASTARKRADVGLPFRPGLLIEAVETDTPAAAAGLHVGDLLVKCNDTPITSLVCLERATNKPSTRLTLTVHRQGDDHALTITP